jgi:hypothetical protein
LRAPSSSKEGGGGANAESGVQALDDPRRRHSIRWASLLFIVSKSAEEEISMELVVVTSSKMCSLDPVEPASITCHVPRGDMN